MNNNEVTGFKIAEYLMSKGFSPAPEAEFNAKGMLLVNKNSTPYGVVFVSLENKKPAYYDQLINKMNEKLNSRVAVLAFDNMSLKFEYQNGELFTCGSKLHKDLNSLFPGLANVVEQNKTPSNEVTQVIVNDIQNKVLKDIVKETSRAAKVVTSRTDISMWIIAGMFALAFMVPFALMELLLPDVWASVTETTRLIISGASYGLLTFNEGQYWRLFTGFLVNDVLWIAIVLFSLRQVIPTVESVYGKFRTIAIFIITGIIITYAKTIIHPHSLSYGAQEVIFCMLGMLLYYGYYDRLLLKMYLTRPIQSFIVLAIISIFFSPVALIYIVMSIILGYLLASIFGFKNSVTTKEVIIPIAALSIFVGVLVFIQLNLNWAYSNIDQAKDIMNQLWSKLF